MALIVIATNLIKGTLERADGTADYDVEVSVNRAKFIWTGTITNHIRSEGAGKLLRLIADKIDQNADDFPLDTKEKLG